MPKILLLVLLAAAALLVGAAPAIAVPAPAAQIATVEDCDPDVDLDCDLWEDEEEWDDEEPIEGCYEEWDDDLGEWVLIGDACEDDDVCFEDWGDGDDWGDEDLASVATSDDEDLCDEDWDDAAEPLAPRVSKLRATPSRRGRGTRVTVRFRLDRAGRVELRLERVGRGARTSRPPRGAITLSGRSGRNETTLRRWKGRKLAPGTYRLTATPLAPDASAAKATFTLKSRR